MPSWKKVVVSGSDATLNSVSGSSFVYSGADVTAQQNLRSINSSGDEGGEIFLSKAATNTTLTGGVTIDVWQNRLRFFEQGGTARGYFLDISAGGAGVATNLASGGGTVTSVGGQGSVSGITLTGTVTASGSLTLGGSISGLTNSNLSGTAGITNANLANSSVTVGSTAIALGASATTIAGLSSVTSTTFVGALTGNASTATQTTATVTGTNSADLVYGNMADNDQFRIRVGGTATNAGFVEIATADDGTEPIYVRQYTGVFTSLARTATLLDGSGNTSFPGTVTANGTLLTGNTGTVTSVSGTGTVNGITLTGTVTSTGNLTLGGTLSGIGNSQLTNSAITIAGTSTSLGGSITQATILAGSGVFSGSAQIPNSSIANAQLANSTISGVALGSTLAALTAGTYLTSGGTFNGSTARTFAVDATDANTVSKVVARDASGNFAAGRITTSGLYGPAVFAGNNPIWQFDASSTGYGIVYNEGTPDTMRFDVSGNALTGTPDFLVGDDYAQINGNTVWHAGNDGASSGLDADLLDGQHGSFYYAASNPSGYTTNTGTVTSVATAGSVNGITLTGGPITGTGTITLGGTLSGIGNAQLTNSSITVGSTAISLGATSTALLGLSSVTSTNFVGTASNIAISDQSLSGASWYPTFAGSGGTSLGQGPMVYTPSLNFLQTTVTAANTVQTISTATNASFFVTFVDANNGSFGTYEQLNTDAGIAYNPSTNILTTTASFATNAASASAVLAGDFAAGTYSVPWMSNKTPGAATYFEGDTILQYETATGRLSTTTFNGALTGNATTATTAASSSTILANNFAAGTYSIPWMSQTSAGVATRLNGGTSLTYITSTGQLNNTGSVHIQQTSNVNGSGVRLRQQGTANYWDMFVTASSGATVNTLQFRYSGGANGGYLDAAANVAAIDFTGQHRSLSNTINITGSADLTGLIVVADGTYTNLNNNHLPQINEALPNVSLSTTINDKRVFGVISDKEERGSRQYAMGAWVSTFNVLKTEDPRLIINSLGEGGMWICNANGTLENGDYITTSNLPGYGMKQSDDVLHNYTVAKITEDCLFDSIRTIDFEYSGSAYKKQFVGVTYHCG
jgi:hypothetical protein